MDARSTAIHRLLRAFFALRHSCCPVTPTPAVCMAGVSAAALQRSQGGSQPTMIDCTHCAAAVARMKHWVSGTVDTLKTRKARNDGKKCHHTNTSAREAPRASNSNSCRDTTAARCHPTQVVLGECSHWACGAQVPVPRRHREWVCTVWEVREGRGERRTATSTISTHAGARKAVKYALQGRCSALPPTCPACCASILAAAVDRACVPAVARA